MRHWRKVVCGVAVAAAVILASGVAVFYLPYGIIWSSPLRFLVTVKKLPLAVRLRANVSDDTAERFWDRVDAFAGENGFQWEAKKADPVARIETAYDRSDGIRLHVWRLVGNVDIGWFTSDGDPRIARILAEKFVIALPDVKFTAEYGDKG
jgi:hypothetical protein